MEVAALSATASYSTALAKCTPRCVAVSRPGVVTVECAHHVNKKATGKHNKRRPKKRSLWDKKRGGTKDYGPLPEAPPVWELEEAEGESTKA